MIKLDDDREVRRHVDHVRLRTVQVSTPTSNDDDWMPSTTNSDGGPSDEEPPQPALRRSTRVGRPPERFMNIQS